MLLKLMIINKDVNRKVLRDYFFIKGSLDIDFEYFIQKIKQGCSLQDNLSFKTNIKGLMTHHDFFNEDPKFNEILIPLIDYVDSYYQFPAYSVSSSWGFEVRPREKTLFHNHFELWAGVIYLNKCNQPLIFPEIKEEILPEAGSFAIFSGFLKHGTEKNSDSISKFGMSFNMKEITSLK